MARGGRRVGTSSYGEPSSKPPDATGNIEAYQEYCVEHQQHVDENSIPTPTPDELHRIMAGEEVELAQSGIPLGRNQTAAEAIHRSMLGDAEPPQAGNQPGGPPE